MPTMVLDREVEQRLQAERRARGADRYDEVWEGVYMLAPMPNDEHQQLVNRLASIFQDVIDWPGLGDVRPGVNVSDRRENWQDNYRVPDVAVFLRGGHAENRGAYWLGGPDFAAEITSPDDQTRQKLPFYEKVAVRELLLVDRDSWTLELYRLQNSRLVQAGCSSRDGSDVLASEVLPFTFQLVDGQHRPQIRIIHTASGKTWIA